MNTQHNSTHTKDEVYSISGFRDTLTSPIFYPVIVVALVLGITSVLNLEENPLKLKSMVTVIKDKVSTAGLVNRSATEHWGGFTDDLYDPSSAKTPEQHDFVTDVLAQHVTQKIPVDESIERLAFNYDLRSESFWTDLDSSKLETAGEEMERKQREIYAIGVPIELDKLEKMPSSYRLEDDSIYTLRANADVLPDSVPTSNFSKAQKSETNN